MVDKLEQPSIKKNFIMNAILTMSSFIFPLITFPYISRVLLVTGIGKVSFATSIISYFTIFAQLGIPTYGIRVCAQVRGNKEELSRVTHELLLINIVTTIISYIVFVVSLLTVPKMRDEKILMILMSFTIILSTIGMEWLYKALEKYTYITVRSLIFKLISVAAMFLFVHDKSDYIIYGAISVFAAGASNILNIINAKKYIFFHYVGEYNFKKHLKSIGIFFAMACAVTIYTHLDTVMLGFMTTDVDVGYYNVAVKIKTILTSIVTSLGTVLLPRASYYIQYNELDKFYKVSKKAFNFVFIISVPLIIYFMFLADEVIRLLSGPTYGAAVPAMIIIMPTVFLIGLNNILAIQMLIPLGKEKTVFYAELVGAVIDIVLNYIFIPIFKSSGAAIGTLVAEIIVTFICYWALRKETAEGFREISYWKIIISLALGFASLVLMRFISLTVFWTLFISAVFFFGIYILSLYLLKEKLTRDLIDQILKKIKGAAIQNEKS